MSGRDHVRARDVQGVALTAVEARMLTRRQVLDPVEVGRPAHVVRILRTGHGETEFRQAARWLQQEAVERGLPIRAVCPEISEAPFLLRGDRRVDVWIDGAVQRTSSR